MKKRKRHAEGKQSEDEKANHVPTLKEVGMKKDLMNYTLT